MNAADLVLGVPSKGRLQENANAFFARAGLPVIQPGGARNYRGRLGGVDRVEVAFLSASEITREIAAGNVHMGVTGLDLVAEEIADPAAKVHVVTELGFGFADVVVAVPQAWIDVADMSDIADVAVGFRHAHGHHFRIATKYVNVTRRFFSQHGISAYRIVESLGATEGAPAAGSAEAIVDITTTGSTLAANGLKIVADGVILKSQAALVAALAADWTTEARAAARTMLDRVGAEANARRTREVLARVDDPAAVAATVGAAFGAVLPFGLPATGGPLVLHAAPGKVPALAEHLRAAGAEMVTVKALDYVFTAANPLVEALEARLDD
jgi:ATP phosphoribosyltransferase